MITNGPPKDKVLWQYRMAAAVMRRGDFPLAKSLLDDALLTLGGIFGKDKSASQARGYFHEEAKKTFIGEPYERVMAYYYRGILYWMDGEPDNARACFRTAEFEDSDAEKKEYAGDWVLPDYLDGLATAKLGGDGSDAFKRADKESKLSKLPPYDLKANVILFLEFGPGPVKYGAGEYREQLRFRDIPEPVRTAVVNVAGQKLTAGPCDDLQYQATTRGGRVMDHVLGNKAVFKAATDAAGTVAIVGGVIAASQHNRTSQQVGVGLIVAGVASKIFSASTTPAADIRTWDNLPRFLTFATLTLPPGAHPVTVEFLDGAGRPIANLTKTITINVAAGRDKIVFVSDQSSTPQTL
jgi:hypothetical protein